MKKYLIIIFLIILIADNNNPVLTVYGSINETVLYQVNSNEITTKNINNFNDIKIISIKPYIPIKYYPKFDFDEYIFTEYTRDKNISNLIQRYQVNLDKIGDINLKNEITVNGVKITEVIIEANKNQIELLKTKYNDITITEIQTN